MGKIADEILLNGSLSFLVKVLLPLSDENVILAGLREKPSKENTHPFEMMHVNLIDINFPFISQRKEKKNTLAFDLNFHQMQFLPLLTSKMCC